VQKIKECGSTKKAQNLRPKKERKRAIAKTKNRTCPVVMFELIFQLPGNSGRKQYIGWVNSLHAQLSNVILLPCPYPWSNELYGALAGRKSFI
jgi:hypothetical protein